jgi:hypothetical protein
MRAEYDRSVLTAKNCRLFAAAAVFIVAGYLMIGLAPPAQALPSFPRQTGQPCGTCHTDFPFLTPFGRRFKLLGYTTGGGAYKTTPFSDNNGPREAYAELYSYANRMESNTPGQAPAGDKTGDKTWVPPLSMMAIIGNTHTQVPSVTSPTDPYQPNDNTVLSPFSVFWGGAITSNVGAFVQVTHNSPDPVSALTGNPVDHLNHNWSWDNADVRYANTANLGWLDLIYGITANNNPTVQDLWNTTPGWSFPQATSTLANTPGAATLIEGTFSMRVAGIGAYAMLNDTLYLELTGYKTLGFNAQNNLGVNPFGGPGLINGVAPYWRIALEPHWGPHTFMLGTYGMIANVNPWVDATFAQGTTAVVPLTDKFTDIGIDSQYQYQGPNYWVTLRANYIREYQRLDASFFATNAANPTNSLNSLKLTGSLAFGADNRIVLTGQYFNVWGSPDAALFADTAGFANMSPNSDGWMAELAYIPFSASKAPGWPWFNARIGLQYTYYNKFNGTTVGAHDNNTLFLHAWLAM